MVFLDIVHDRPLFLKKSAVYTLDGLGPSATTQQYEIFTVTSRARPRQAFEPSAPGIVGMVIAPGFAAQSNLVLTASLLQTSPVPTQLGTPFRVGPVTCLRGAVHNHAPYVPLYSKLQLKSFHNTLWPQYICTVGNYATATIRDQYW